MSRGINSVNIGINEDCWLDINGVPTAFGGTNYINAIVHETQTLEANGMTPIISYFWGAPGSTPATGQAAMPDNDHTAALWQSITDTFKTDPNVILRLKEEPHQAGNSDGASVWGYWKNGDRQYDTSNTLVPMSSTANCSEGYPVVGMQSLVNIVRGTGAINVIMVPGVQFANSMTHFLDAQYRVTDTLATPQLAAVVDVYPFDNICGSPPSPQLPPPTVKTGDINRDGKVDIFDLSILLTNYAGTLASCDLNRDGHVTVIDLSILLSNFGK